jgi:uncharacterized protein YecA (UPF0149 family)
MPDLAAAFQAIDQDPDPQKRLELKAKTQSAFEDKSQRIHTISQMLKAYCLPKTMIQNTAQVSGAKELESLPKAKPIRSGPKIGRNDPCPCGSGKKHKVCCGE